MFGYSLERKLERQMISDYERLLDEIAARLEQGNHSSAVALAELPLEVKGFGHVKLANYKASKRREADLLQAFTNPAPVKVAAE